MLVYTRDMITAIVAARGDITTAHKLVDIVKDHVSGNFNNFRVSQYFVMVSSGMNKDINCRLTDI